MIDISVLPNNATITYIMSQLFRDFKLSVGGFGHFEKINLKQLKALAFPLLREHRVALNQLSLASLIDAQKTCFSHGE